jgi:hypothetical protein
MLNEVSFARRDINGMSREKWVGQIAVDPLAEIAESTMPMPVSVGIAGPSISDHKLIPSALSRAMDLFDSEDRATKRLRNVSSPFT